MNHERGCQKFGSSFMFFIHVFVALNSVFSVAVSFVHSVIYSFTHSADFYRSSSRTCSEALHASTDEERHTTLGGLLGGLITNTRWAPNKMAAQVGGHYRWTDKADICMIDKRTCGTSSSTLVT